MWRNKEDKKTSLVGIEISQFNLFATFYQWGTISRFCCCFHLSTRTNII